MGNSIKKLLEDIIKGGVFNEFYKKDIKLSLEYNYTDVLRIEKYINRRFQSNEEPPSHIVIPLGVYLGQLLMAKATSLVSIAPSQS